MCDEGGVGLRLVGEEDEYLSGGGESLFVAACP